MKQKRGEGKQIFYRGGQSGSRGGCLKKRGVWNPLTNYVNNKRKNKKEKMKKSDKILVGREESTEEVIQKCSVNKVFGKNV